MDSSRKRILIPSSIRAKRRKRSESEEDDSTFTKFLKSCEFFVKSGDEPHQIWIEQELFKKRLRSRFKSEFGTEAVQAFMKGLEEKCRQLVTFRRCLVPSITPSEADTASKGRAQDSLIKLLLGVDTLHIPVMKFLLHKLDDFCANDSIDDGHENVNFSSLILNHMRYLEKIENTDEVLDKLLSIIPKSCLSVKRDIVTSLPEMLGDDLHDKAADKLRVVSEGDLDLISSVLDALSNMNVCENTITEVGDHVLEIIQQLQSDDVAIAVRFLMQNTPSKQLPEVCSSIRRLLNFNQLKSPKNTPRPKSQKIKNRKIDSASLLLNTVKSAVKFERKQAEAWLKAIENANELCPFDMCLLFVLDSSNLSKQAISTFRNKIRNRQINNNVIERTFNGYSKVIQSYFTSILLLADNLFKSNEDVLNSFGCDMLKLAFPHFDYFEKQEIVRNLFSYLESTSPNQVNAGLDILSYFVNNYISDMEPFTIFVQDVFKNQLKILQAMTITQLQKLFYILCLLAFDAEQNASLTEDLKIRIMKLLATDSVKKKSIGIIGAIHVFQYLGRSKTDIIDSESSDYFDSENLEEVERYFNVIKNCLKCCPEAEILLYDELTELINNGGLHKDVELINAFCQELKSPKVATKIIRRLQNVIDIRKVIDSCLSGIKDYSPPLAYANLGEKVTLSLTSTVTKKKATKKKVDKSNDTTTDNESIFSIDKSENFDDDTTSTAITSSTQSKQFREFFREMDLHNLRLIEFGISDDSLKINISSSNVAETNDSLTLNQLGYLLDDFKQKLDIILPSSSSSRHFGFKTSKIGGLKNFLRITDRQLVEFFNQLLPTLLEILERSTGKLQEKIDENDGVLDGPAVNSVEGQQLNLCYEKLINILCSFFSWSGFKLSNNKALLQKAVEMISGRISSNTGNTENAFIYFANLTKFTNRLSIAVTICRILLNLLETCRCDPETEKNRIANLAEEFLKREWWDGKVKDKGAKYHENIDFFVGIYLSNKSPTMDVLSDVLEVGIKELTDDGQISETYQTLNKSTLPIYYKHMMSTLLESMQTIGKARAADDSQTKLEILRLWIKHANFLNVLLGLVKMFDSRQILLTVFKVGTKILDLFKKFAVSTLDCLLKSHKDKCLSFITAFKKCNSLLQHCTTYVKGREDPALANHVPVLKSTMEAVIYSIESMVYRNQCGDAFLIGNMKNRTLQGSEIYDMNTQESESDVLEKSPENNADEMASDIEDDQDMSASL
ncbi:DgyrCDS1567 [Dimorphilus gyrociliatus]|uniref:DgyrCDS1567 n=1 Tax=Dimorphilus gyrociliatus TaxID=2664684 RepID=A0A7I8V9J4_9ANNE|nr:DgyrCDS1567 [Dimorphilus gyrociliatus]